MQVYFIACLSHVEEKAGRYELRKQGLALKGTGGIYANETGVLLKSSLRSS
jgi:hypothetical protein